MVQSARFRANVGILVIDAQGRVLAGERSEPRDSWQLPQGGIDAGETALEAFYRELTEETGLVAEDVTIVAEHPEWLAYEWPPEHVRKDGTFGQVQKWFLVRIRDGVEPDAADTDDEFVSFKWTRLAELTEEVIDMRRNIYRRLVEDFADHLA